MVPLHDAAVHTLNKLSATWRHLCDDAKLSRCVASLTFQTPTAEDSSAAVESDKSASVTPSNVRMV